MSPPPAAVPPPSLKRARRDSESSPSQSPVTCTAATTANDQMEAPLAVALSQSMDSVNTATGEEEVSSCVFMFGGSCVSALSAGPFPPLVSELSWR